MSDTSLDYFPVFMPASMWARRDVEEIGKFINGLSIYDHAFRPPSKDWIGVSIGELVEAGAVKMLTLHNEIRQT